MNKAIAIVAVAAAVSAAAVAAYAALSFCAARAFDGEPGVWCDDGDSGWERP